MLDKLIVMLTHHDQTRPDAAEVFDRCRDLPVQNWGFKDVGIEAGPAKELVQAMKQAGKTTFLEVVTYTEPECLKGAELAVECGFDYLIGTIFYDSVAEYANAHDLNYLPFVGQVSGSPSVLEGTVEEFLDQAAAFKAKGAVGTDLLGYRLVSDDPEPVIKKFIADSPLPTVLAGSIAGLDRIKIVKEMDPWLFTIGSALFDGVYVADGDAYANLAELCELLRNL